MGSDLENMDKGAHALDTMNNTVQNTTGKSKFPQHRGSEPKTNAVTPGLRKHHMNEYENSSKDYSMRKTRDISKTIEATTVPVSRLLADRNQSLN